MSARTRTPVVATVAGDCTTPEDVKIAMYRIAQEALNNVVKHARANQVRIDLRGEPDHLTLSVHDDGRGFDPASVESHQLGLGIMRERAKRRGCPLVCGEPARSGHDDCRLLVPRLAHRKQSTGPNRDLPEKERGAGWMVCTTHSTPLPIDKVCPEGSTSLFLPSDRRNPWSSSEHR